MKHLLVICLSLLATNNIKAQLTFSAGPAPYSLYLLPFAPSCIGDLTASATATTITATFRFNGVQCCACPSSGTISLPGGVTYGGSGSSASFTHYHTLSYSGSNEHQQLQFSAPVNIFQFSSSGNASGADQMSIQVFNGPTLLATYNFMTAGIGSNNTFHIVDAGAGFTRVAFVEIGSINADDELLGDFFINDQIIPLSNDSLNFKASIEQANTSHALLTWNEIENKNITSFDLYESTDGFNWELINEQQVSSLSHNYHFKSEIRANVQYYYRLEAYDQNFELIQSQIRDLKMLDFDLMIFPNPAKDGFYITQNGSYLNNTIVITDMIGKEIEVSPVSLNYYSTENLSNGIYILKGTNQKIVVQH